MCSYFFLYPVGHFGFTPVTFFVSFPLTQVIVDFFAAAITDGFFGVGVGEAATVGSGVGVGVGVGVAVTIGVGVGVGVGVGSGSWKSVTLISGSE